MQVKTSLFTYLIKTKQFSRTNKETNQKKRTIYKKTTLLAINFFVSQEASIQLDNWYAHINHRSDCIVLEWQIALKTDFCFNRWHTIYNHCVNMRILKSPTYYVQSHYISKSTTLNNSVTLYAFCLNISITAFFDDFSLFWFIFFNGTTFQAFRFVCTFFFFICI